MSDVLVKMIHEWPNKDDPAVESQSARLKSATIAEFINDHRPSELKTLLRELLFPGLPAGETVSPDAVGRRLAAQVGNVVECEERNVVLRSAKPKGGGGRAAKVYYVEFIDGLPAPEENLWQGTWGLRGLLQPLGLGKGKRSPDNIVPKNTIGLGVVPKVPKSPEHGSGTGSLQSTCPGWI